MTIRVFFYCAGEGNTLADSTVEDCVTGSTIEPVCKATMPSMVELLLAFRTTAALK